MAQSPGKFGGQSSWLLVDGYNLISGMKIKGLRCKVSQRQEETTGLGDSNPEHTPTGMGSVELAQDGGFFDTNTNASHAALSGSVPTSPQATQRVLCFGFAGHTIGEPFVGVQGAYTQSYNVLADLGNLTKANAEYKVSGQVDHGTIIQGLATKTADWNTKTDGVQVDYTLDTAQTVRAISSSTVANPTVVTTVGAHGLTTGDIILISGSDSTPTLNGSRTVTVISSTTFSIPVNVSSGATTGSFVKASSANGAVGFQQVTAFSGFSSFVGKLRDSADDSTYADLVTFASISAIGAERATTSGVVDRWVSYDGNVTGSGSITVFAGLSRG